MNFPIEVVISLERSDCAVSKMISQMDGVKSLTRLKIEKDETIHGLEKENLTDHEIAELRKISTKVTKVGKNKLWIISPSCSACTAMALSDAVIISARSLDENHVAYRILMNGKGTIRKLIRDLREKNLNPQIIEEPEEIKNELSEREFSVLKICYDLGYFENDRGASLTEIAEILDVSTSSLSETLRRAMKKIVKDYLKNREI
ncbi:helix-turn-helix domain-containing protein [Caldiplasma sukawensis]